MFEIEAIQAQAQEVSETIKNDHIAAGINNILQLDGVSDQLKLVFRQRLDELVGLTFEQVEMLQQLSRFVSEEDQNAQGEITAEF